MSQLRVLAVAAGRGGTGKSTLAFGLADEIRRTEPTLDVALVDLDPQAGLTGYAKLAPAADPVHDAPGVAHGLTVYRGGRALAHATDAQIAGHLERALNGGAGERDRVLVVDMAPALTDAAHRAVFARDDVMLVGAIKTEPGRSIAERARRVRLQAGLPYLLVPTIHRSVLLNNTMLLTMRQQHEGHVSDAVFPLDGKAAECVGRRPAGHDVRPALQGGEGDHAAGAGAVRCGRGRVDRARRRPPPLRREGGARHPAEGLADAAPHAEEGHRPRHGQVKPAGPARPSRAEL
jgi:chromosome partitioning protein